MKDDSVKRLTDYGTLHKEAPDYLMVDDILRQEVVITAAEFHLGEFDRYVIMTVVLGDEEVKVRTGGKFVVDALDDVVANDAFPVRTTFVKRGRSIRFA